MGDIRVLVVDDSSVVRQMVSRIIEGDPDMTVVGTARNGLEALRMIDELAPDIVTLDIEMPRMDGLSVLRKLRERRSKVPVVMLSTLTSMAAAATLDSLSLGAKDYATKPTSIAAGGATMDQLAIDLVAKLKAIVAPRGSVSTGRVVGRRADSFISRKAPIEALVIASSTGGPNALSTVFGTLQETPPVPIFIVQHIPPVFSTQLAARLDGIGPMTVVEAAAGMEVKPGTAYLAPGDFHMTVKRSKNVVYIDTNKDELVSFCRPAADALLPSVAEVYGGNVLVAVLTGMGADSLAGCRRLAGLGASILVQDAATSVVWGMPAAVAGAGLANENVPIGNMAKRIEAWFTRHARKMGRV